MALGIFKKAWNTTQLTNLTDYFVSLIPFPKSYCVFWDEFNALQTNVTSTASVVNCLLGENGENGINSGDFNKTPDSTGIEFIGNRSMPVIINVTGSVVPTEGSSGVVNFFIWKGSSGLLPSSQCFVPIPVAGASFSILCGTYLNDGESVKVYVDLLSGSPFSFILQNINISITEV
jgi:hypothetical protein